MSNSGRNKKNIAKTTFTVLVLFQVVLATGLLILGIKGKEEIGTGTAYGVPYYVGALLVSSVFIMAVLQIVVVLILASFQEESCRRTTSYFIMSSCLFNVFGVLCCICGMVFIIGFGIAGCSKSSKESQATQTETGSCSYPTNNENNYAIAVVSLVLTLVMFISAGCSFYVLSKYSGALVSRKETATTHNQVTPVSSPIHIENGEADSSQRSNPNLLLLMQLRHLQQRNRELQTQITAIQSGRNSRRHPSSAAPRSDSGDIARFSEIYILESPIGARDINHEDRPPSYNSLMYSLE